MDDFNKFWVAYPKKRSKGEAHRAWLQTAKKRPPLEQILKSLVVLKASPEWTKESGQFIPYPSTWLRAWGWDDVPEVEMAEIVNGKMWWETNSGIESKARELGLTLEQHGYDWQKFKHAIFKAAGVVPIQKTA